jgi:ABC-type transporter Mla subunit MlaD
MNDITIRIPGKVLKVAYIALGIICLWWAGAHLWSSDLFRPKYEIRMILPDSGGIHAGALVTLNGLPVGKVSRVTPALVSADVNRRIEIDLRIQKRFQSFIREDSTASISPQGLLGDTFVNIFRGFAGPPISSGGEIRAIETKQVSAVDLINAIGKVTGCRDSDKDRTEEKSSSDTKNVQKSR